MSQANTRITSVNHPAQGLADLSQGSIYCAAEDLTAKLESLSGAFGRIAQCDDDSSPLFYTFMNLVDALRDEASHLTERLRGQGAARATDADPAVVANDEYQAIEEAANHQPGDVSEEDAAAMSGAYRACMGTPAASLAGVTAKMQAYVRWRAGAGDGSEDEQDAKAILADLERLTGKVVRP